MPVEYYTVAETARRAHMSPHTLRYYSKEGLLPFVDRTSANVRVFTEEDLEWLYLINCLKTAGVSIKDIRQFIEWALEGDATIGQRLEMFKEQQRKVEQQIAELQDVLDVLKYKRWRYEVSLKAGTTAVHETLDPADMPNDIRAIAERVDHEIHDGAPKPRPRLKHPSAAEA